MIDTNTAPIDDGYMLGMIFQGRLGQAIDILMRNAWPAKRILQKLDEYTARQWITRVPGSMWDSRITPKGEDMLMRLVPQSRDAVRAVKDSREFGKTRR